MNEENLEALIPCAGDGAWNLLPGEAPQVLLVGTSALETSSKQAEQSTALHTVVSTPKYAVTWRERREQHY